MTFTRTEAAYRSLYQHAEDQKRENAALKEAFKRTDSDRAFFNNDNERLEREIAALKAELAGAYQGADFLRERMKKAEARVAELERQRDLLIARANRVETREQWEEGNRVIAEYQHGVIFRLKGDGRSDTSGEAPPTRAASPPPANPATSNEDGSPRDFDELIHRLRNIPLVRIQKSMVKE